MGKTILIIGVRRKCYKAAINLGYDVLLWSDGPLHESRKKDLIGWLEVPYALCKDHLTEEVIQYLKKHDISRVIANSEETVILGAKVRKLLCLKTLGFKLSERFHNKFVMKNAARKAGIPITNYKLIDESTTPEFLIEQLGLPIVIKPVDESGAQDVKITKTKNEVKDLIQVGLLAESFVEGSEISVETFVQAGEPIFHNCTEYLHQWKKSVVPAKLEPSLQKQILELNDKVIKHFKLNRGMTHAEFYLTKNGPVFGEIAVRPPGGYYMELIERVYGFDTWKAYVELSCGKTIETPNSKPKGHAAVVMFHPESAGRVKSIQGEREVRSNLAEIMEFKIRRKPGDVISKHTNTSNEVGHILFWEKTREDLFRGIEFVDTNLKFQMDSTTSD